MKKLARACYERWGKLPFWLKTGLCFVVIDIFLWIFLYVVPMFVRAGWDLFILLFIANPLAVIWFFVAFGNTGIELTPIIEATCLVFSGLFFYFFIGAIIGFLFQRTKNHKRQG